MAVNKYGDEIIDIGGQASGSSGGGGMMGALSWLNPFPQNTKHLINSYNNISQFNSKLPNSKGNLGKSISNAAAATGNAANQLLNPFNPTARNAMGEDALYSLLDIYGKGPLKAGGKKVGSEVGAGLNTVRYPTNKLLANATDRAAVGESGTWNELNKRFTEGTMKKFGIKSGTDTTLSPVIQDALNSIQSRFTPASLEKNPSINPLELLQNRRTILNEYGSGPSKIAQFISGASASPEQKVASVMRNTLSGYLHELAPKTQALDQLYSRYAKIGSPVTMGKRILGGIVADQVGKYAGPFRPAIDSLAGYWSGKLF